MSSIRCSRCGLSNFQQDAECRRCGNLLFGREKKVEKPARRYSVISFVIYAALIVGGYYIYQGIKRSIEAVDPPVPARLAAKPNPSPGLSRNEADRQKAAKVGQAISENPALAKQKKHNEDTQKALEQVQNGGN